MAKRLLQAVILTIIINVLASTNSPSFSSITPAKISQASKTSLTLLYRWLDSLSDRLNSNVHHLTIEQFDRSLD